MPSLNFNIKNGLSIGVGSTILNTSNGNIGIGVFVPTSKLQVAGTVAATNFSGSGSSLTSIPNSALTNSSVTISTSSGLSGGGTLSLGGSLTLTNTGVISLSASGPGLSLNASTGSITISAGSTNINTPNTLVFRDASGNFSAGTITANLTGTASNASLATNVVGNANQVLYNSSSNTTTTSSNLVFNGTQLGIARSPSYTLDVGGDINFTGIFYQNGSPFVASRWTAGTGTSIYRLSNVGIGTSTPTQSLHVQGNARITGSLIDSNNGTGTTWQALQSTGTGTTWGMRIYTENTYNSIGVGTNSLANFVTSGDPILNWFVVNGNSNQDTSYTSFPGTIIQDSKDYGIRSLSNYTPQVVGGKVPSVIPPLFIYVVGGLTGNSILLIQYNNFVNSQTINYDFDSTTVFQIPTSDIGGTLPLQFTLDKTKFPKYIFSNISIGRNSGFNRTSGYANIGIGGETLFSSTTSIGNIALGPKSQYSNTTGGNNISLGAQSLLKNKTGNSNIAIGLNSGTSLTTGSQNILLGQSTITTGNPSFCTLIGNAAGNLKGSGNYDTGIGYRSLGYVGTYNTLTFTVQNGGSGYTDGTYSIFLVSSGAFSGTKDVDIYTVSVTIVVSGGVVQSAYQTSSQFWQGSLTPQVGDLLYPYAISGSLNPGKGLVLQVASASTTYAGNNTALGSFALTNLRTGGNNIAVGYNAGAGTTIGSSNLFLGYSAGSALGSESNNVIIGGNTGSGLVGLSNTVLIADGAGNERIRIDSSGNVGIGINSPNDRVTIVGSSVDTGLTVRQYTNTAEGGIENTIARFGAKGIWSAQDAAAIQIGYSKISSIYTGSGSNWDLIFKTGTSGSQSERLRIDSSGNTSIGVNTAVAGSNTYRLLSSVPGTSALYQLGLQYPSVATYGFTVDSSGNLFIAKDGTERLRIDSSGNLGLGVVPSVWTGAGVAFETVGGAILGQGTNNITFFQNTYYSSGFKYKTTNPASMYDQNAGAHRWFTAPSGTAGNAITFTQAMALDASSNLTLAGTFTLTNTPFFRNVPTIASDYSITTSYNEMSIGPITINSGITVTIQSGATWTIV